MKYFITAIVNNVNAICSTHKSWKDSQGILLASSECDIHLLELIKSGQDTSSSHSSQDVSSSSLHQGHESLVLEDLSEAIQRSIVLNSTTRGHHHPPSDGVDGVGHEPSRDGHSPSKEEGKSHSSILPKDEWLESVVEAEVHATVNENSDGRDDKASIKSLYTIRLESLHVDIN